MPQFPFWRVKWGERGGLCLGFSIWVLGGVGGGGAASLVAPMRSRVGAFCRGRQRLRASVSLLRKSWGPFRMGGRGQILTPPPLLPAQGLISCPPPPCLSFPSQNKRPPTPAQILPGVPNQQLPAPPTLSGVTLKWGSGGGGAEVSPHPTHSAVPRFPPPLQPSFGSQLQLWGFFTSRFPLKSLHLGAELF